MAVAGATFATLIATPAAEPAAKPKPRRGGTVVVALHLDPPSLNYYLDLGAFRSTSEITDQVLASAYHDVGRSGESVPDLIVGDPKIRPKPFSLTYTIKREGALERRRPDHRARLRLHLAAPREIDVQDPR